MHIDEIRAAIDKAGARVWVFVQPTRHDEFVVPTTKKAARRMLDILDDPEYEGYPYHVEAWVAEDGDVTIGR